MLAHAPPHLARVRLRLRDAEVVEPHARRVQQPRHVVVGRHAAATPGRRTARRRAAGAGRRGRAARSTGSARTARVELARDRPDAGSGGQQPVGVKHERPLIVQQCGSAGLDRARPWAGSGGVRPRLSSRPCALDGRSVCVIVPDGTRSCPLPLLLSAVHDALDGRATRMTVLVALGTHAPMAAEALAAHVGPASPRATTSGGTRTRSSASAGSAPSGSGSSPAGCSTTASRSASTAPSSSTTSR